MAKIDLSKTIIGLDGKVMNGVKEAFVVTRDSSTGKEEFLKNSQGEDVVITKETPNDALTVKKQLIQVLLATSQTTQASEKAERYALFYRIESAKNNIIEMTAEDITLCKKCLNEFASILVAGRVSFILEGKDVDSVSEDKIQ
jgi:hypothetical protein